MTTTQNLKILKPTAYELIMGSVTKQFGGIAIVSINFDVYIIMILILTFTIAQIIIQYVHKYIQH